MAIDRSGRTVSYSTRRTSGSAALRARYRPVGDVFHARPGTLEHFLTERYCLYTVHRDAVIRADIDHPPWPLQAAEAEIEENSMAAPAGLELPPREPLLHFAARQDVVIWSPEAVRQ
jgi:uncharacterized protein YqjF (DUF2071 family)